MAKSIIPHMSNPQEPEWVVWLTVIIGLSIGWLVYHQATGKMVTATAGNTTISYPARWIKMDRKDVAFAATDFVSGPNGPQVLIRQLAKSELSPPIENSQASPVDPIANWILTRGKDLTGYRVLNIKPTRVQGHEAAMIDSLYLSEASGTFAPDAAPALIHASDTAVTIGDQVYILTFTAESHEFSKFDSLHQKLLDGWRLP